jgi:hypothetical protein
MDGQTGHVTDRHLRTPRAAAIAGILFAVLFATSYWLIYQHAPGNSADFATWLAAHAETVTWGVSLLPFAGIAFLWFMGVVRDAIGYLEDQFFSTLFLGSGFLYLAMTFMSAATARGALSIYALNPQIATEAELFDMARAISNAGMTVYAMRMAGMFAFVLGTIWIRTGLMPRWMIVLTYASALLLLFSIDYNRWMVMVFPGWVLLVSILLLLRNYRQGDPGDGGR